MAIANTEIRGNQLYIYDEKGHQTGYFIFLPGDQVVGVTAVAVSIKKGNMVYTYDEKGHQISSRIG
ncbi:MAG: hypothetical protein PUI29_05355 [Aeromonadales bacterium]|nr:hypothetical protein [Aeromonadales bacterium]MDY2891371.1 hypothetical protein [Succinivibrio sp.]